MVNSFAPSWARVPEGKSCCLRPLSFPGGRNPRPSLRARAPRQACMAAVSGSSSAAQPGQPGPLPADRPAARLLPQLPPSSCSFFSSCRRRQGPDTVAAPWRSRLRGRGVATPDALPSAGRGTLPAGRGRSSAPTAWTTSSGSPAARSAPAPAPPLRSVLSRGPCSARSVPERSGLQVPPPAPPALPRWGREQGNARALGLQSFSSRGGSWNKRGGGAEDRRNSWKGVGPPETGNSGYFPSLSKPLAHTPGASGPYFPF